MGASQSLPTRPAGAAVPASLHRLSEHQAFEIATAWHRELVGFTLLDVDSHCRFLPDWMPTFKHAYDPPADDFTILEHVEWIDFDFSVRRKGINFKHLIGAVRATTLAWFALSCCPGFAGHENPEFWKRVFSMFMRAQPSRTPANSYHLPNGVVTATQRFFEHPDRPFPRIRVAWVNELPIEMLWEAPLPMRDERRLGRIMRELSPFIVQASSQRPIAIALRVGFKNPYLVGETAKLTDKLQRMSLSNHIGPNASKLQLTSVYFDMESFSIECTRAVTRFPHARVYVLKNVEHAEKTVPALKDITTVITGPPAHSINVRSLDIWFGRDTHWGLPRTTLSKWCSALPHAPAVSGVRFYVGGEREIAGAWLGYMLFHPGLATGSKPALENLTLWLQSFHESFVRSLLLMREGNNLLLVVGLATEATSGYHRARVRSGTIVHATPGQHSKVYVFPDEQWITVFGAEASKTHCDSSARQWARVVLPGYGLAWVASQDIIEVVCDAAVSSGVRRLRLVVNDWGNDPYGEVAVLNETIALLLEVLSLVGEKLTYLHIDKPDHCTTQLDVKIIHSILSRCPNLTTFRAPHDGSYWTDDVQTEPPLDRPRLQELELTLPSALRPLTAPQLDDLRVLSVVGYDRSRLSSNRTAVVKTLARYPGLLSFKWRLSGFNAELGTTKSYDARCAEMWQQLAPTSTPRTVEVAQVTFRLDARLAFLSVATSLPQEAVVLIFAFSTSAARRRIHIYDGKE